VNGDTLLLDNDEYVNLIGVDTPETKRFGKEAAKFTRRLAHGKRVRLAFDQATAVIGHKDRYGRTLAYVFLEDGTLLNADGEVKDTPGFISAPRQSAS
jgi:micrococcal nuclease